MSNSLWDTLAAFRHKRALAVAGLVAGFWLLSSNEHNTSLLDAVKFADMRPIRDVPLLLPANRIEEYLAAHLKTLQRGYDAVHDYEEYGLKLGNVTLAGYTAEILGAQRHYLPNMNDAFIAPLKARLSLRTRTSQLPPRPKKIFTTDKTRDALPAEFARWQDLMPDWEINCLDDLDLVAWVEKNFAGTKAERIWKSLPRQVLKTDLFRYMVMLVEGGIYTDSDTAPITHADLWGTPYETVTDPLLLQVGKVFDLLDDPRNRTTVVDDRPGLVVSVESDAIDFGWDWREAGLARAVQITQWTFMARPGHPVMLDAVQRVLANSEEMARQADIKGLSFIPESALEWSGPAVLSDCVYRYLLARYGFHPSQLIHQKTPIRVGDVLILPTGSFSSVSPFSGERQRPYAAAWHGFHGRWRAGDPGQQEFERLKKLHHNGNNPYQNHITHSVTAIEALGEASVRAALASKVKYPHEH